MRLSLVIALAAIVCAAPLHAHNPGLSTSRVRVNAHSVEVHLYFAQTEIAAVLGARSLEEISSANRTRELRALAERAWTINDAKPLETHFEVNGADVEFFLSFALTPSRTSGTPVALRSALLADLAPGHRQLASIVDENGKRLAQKLLSASEVVIELR